MSRQKSKRPTTVRSTDRKAGARSGSARTAVRKATKRKAGAQSVIGRQRRTLEKPRGRADSKQAGIVAMLCAPHGATIQAMADATGWQQHSIRGFLAGVVRKKLGLNLVSAPAEGGRVYRVVDRTGARAEAAIATDRA